MSKSAVATLYGEELKAITRGRFAWILDRCGLVMIGIGIGIGGLAAVVSQDTWLDGYGHVAYFLAPIAFLPLAARRSSVSGRTASSRACSPPPRAA